MTDPQDWNEPSGSKSRAGTRKPKPPVAQKSAPVQVTVETARTARRLLARLRDVMAGTAHDVHHPDARLGKITQIVAEGLHADVCSCYLRRPGDVLELCATVGLNPQAVHQTRLRMDEGIVGDIAAHARPIALSNARTHPSFAYRPETGEERFSSLLGVPLLRGGQVRGVLVIQNEARRHYGEEDIELLQTIAMIVAELVAAGEVAPLPESATPGEGDIETPGHLTGITLHKGLAMGYAVPHRRQITLREMLAEDSEAEIKRLDKALAEMREEIDDILSATRTDSIGDLAHVSHDILEAYRMIAEDRGWQEKLREAIETGLSAEAAVQRVQDDNRVRMSQMEDRYLRERLYDLEDLTNRLLQHLVGRTEGGLHTDLPENAVIIARQMGPAELLEYDRRRVKALILEQGSSASHVAIVARALNIPVLTGVEDALTRIAPLDEVIVDGDHGHVYLKPSDYLLEKYRHAMQLRAQRELLLRGMRRLPAVTLDGTAITVQMNAGLLIDLQHMQSFGADGIGLYRTEIPFMLSTDFPSVSRQMEMYRQVLELAQGKPVSFRTLDIGADKQLPYLPDRKESNPALGWRAIRMGLDRPALLCRQLRALIRAAAGEELQILFPMISRVSEFDAAKTLFEREYQRAKKEGFTLPETVKLGVMVEVPSLLWQVPELLERVDFISVGSNDLAQYFYAADRENHDIASYSDPLSPPFLQALRHLSDSATEAGIPISICGEMASRPLDALALLGIGYRRLSVSAHAIGSIKTMICSVDLEALTPFMHGLLKGKRDRLRTHLLSYAQDHNIVLDAFEAQG